MNRTSGDAAGTTRSSGLDAVRLRGAAVSLREPVRAARVPSTAPVLSTPVLSTIALLLLCLLPPTPAANASDAAGFEVRDVETRLVDGVYRLDADIDFDFSNESLEALHSGVPLTVMVEMEVLRERLLLDAGVVRVTARYQLHVHALSGQYIATDLATGATRSFRTYPEAVVALGRIRDFPLFDAALLERGESYRLRIRARLDVEALPSPMRLIAYFDSLWHLSSNWRSWELQP